MKRIAITMAVAAVAIALISTRSRSQEVYGLTLSPKQVTTLGRALGKQPFDDVVDVINTINAQIGAQNAEANKRAQDDAETLMRARNPAPAPAAPEKPADIPMVPSTD